MEIVIQFRSLIDDQNILKPVSDVDTAGSVRAELYEKESNRFVGYN